MTKSSLSIVKNVAIAFGVLLLILFLSSLVHKRFDVTEEKRFTLTEATQDCLENLTDTIRVTCYLTGDLPLSFVKMEREVSDMLQEFQQKAGKSNFMVKFIDPQSIGDKKNFKHTISRLNKDYGLAPYTIQEEDENGKITQRFIVPGLIVSTSQKFVTVNMLNNTMGNSPEEQINEALQNFEYQCIKAIKQLTATERKNIAFLTGQDEIPLLYSYNATVALLQRHRLQPPGSLRLEDGLHTQQAEDVLHHRVALFGTVHQSGQPDRRVAVLGQSHYLIPVAGTAPVVLNEIVASLVRLRLDADDVAGSPLGIGAEFTHHP